MQDIAGRQPPLCTQPEEFILSCQRKQQPPLQIHLQQSYQRVITRSQSSKAFQERQSQNAVHQLKQQQSLPQPLHSPHTSSAGGHHMHPSKSISIFAYKTLNTVFKSSRKIIVRVCDVASVKKSFTMFKFNKAAAQHRAESRANNCTGHDQFVRPPVSDKPNLKYQYSALDSGNGVAEHISREKTHRDRALIATEEWIQNSNGRYEIISHLHEIGSRHSKNWFLVNDSSVRTDRLLTLLPLPPNCAALEELVQNECPRIVFMELLGSLHHPYIYPVLDLGFLSTSCSNYACLVTPFNSRGSLKDLIYKAQWNEPWERKYTRKPHGLPASQIQRLGRQILEALLFLKERGFPLHGHLHSGNVILQNGAARLSGLENGLLGLSSRVNAVIWSRSTTEIENVDIICFGHLLYEMCTGAEMTTPKPSMRMLRMELDNYPQILDILELIFDPPTGIRPKVEELVLCDIFRSIDLRELRGSSFSTIKPSLSKSTLHLLQAVKKRQRDSLGGSLSEASSPCTPPTTPRDRRSGIMDSLEVSTDCEDDLFEEIFVGYSYQPQVSKIFRIEQNQHLQLVQNSDYHHSKLTEQKQKQRNYLSSSIMYCNNSTHICDKNSRTAEKHQNHHLHTQEQDFRCCSGDSSNLNVLLAKDTAQPRRNGPSDSLASAARTVINPQENTDGIQTTESCQVVPDCIISKDCEAKSNSKQMLVETGASASHQALGNGACTTVGNCISHPRTSVAVTLHNHQLTADKCCYNNSKSRRLEYSLKCLKYGRSNPSQDSAFGSLTDGDLSTGSSSFRLSSFQSMSSPIDEGIEDAIKATTKTGHETNSEFFTIPNNMISQDSAISSPCKEFSPSNFPAIDEGVSISESSSHVHSQQFPVSLASRTLVTAAVNSTSSLGPVNSDQQLQLFDPPKILVNDQNSIYTTSPSKRSGTIEVFSQKYRVSSFEDLSTNQSCYGSGKHLKHVKRMAFRSLEEERRIDSAFKPIQDRTSSEICINVQSDNYKKLTHASFRISETSSQSGSLDTSQGLHVSSTSKISATNILCSCDVCCRATCATKPVSGSTSNRQTIWRVNKFYRKNHIAKSNDSLRETSPNHSTRLSPTLLRNNLYETTPPYESTHNKRHQLLNRHCSANEISYSDHTLRHNLSVSINPFESRRYCSSKSEDLGDPSNFYDDCVMDSRKSYSERTLIDYANTDLKKNKHTGTNVTYIKKDIHNDEDEIKNNIRGESFMQMFQYGNIKHQQCLSTCSINCITRTKLRTTSLAAIPCHQDEAFVQNSFASCKSVKAASANSIRSSALRSPDYAPQSTDNSESSGAETAAEEYSSTEELLVSSHQLLSTAELSRIFATGSADVNSCGDEIPLLGVEMSPITPTERDGDTEFN